MLTLGTVSVFDLHRNIHYSPILFSMVPHKKNQFKTDLFLSHYPDPFHYNYWCFSASSGGDGGSVSHVVQLERDAAGSLGLSIAGGRGSPLGDLPIMVASLSPGGAADRCGGVQV